MPPFSTYPPWFSLSQRKKKPRQEQDTPRYRKRKDMISAPQPSSLPLLFATDSVGHVKTQWGTSLAEQSAHQHAPLPTPRQTPRQTPDKVTPAQPPVVNGKSYGTLVGGRKRKPVLKLNTDESEWHPPQSPFDPRPPSSGCSSPASARDLPLPEASQRRRSPPARLSPRSNSRTPSGSSSSQNSPPVPPRPQRRIVSVSAGPPSYIPPPSTFSSLGPRPISAFPVSSRPAAGLAGRPTSLPADTADIYNFFLGNNVTRKRVDFHEISPRDMRDLATDARSNKRAFAGPAHSHTHEHRRKTVKPRVPPAIPPKPMMTTRQASNSPSSVDKVWFATKVA